MLFIESRNQTAGECVVREKQAAGRTELTPNFFKLVHSHEDSPKDAQ